MFNRLKFALLPFIILFFYCKSDKIIPQLNDYTVEGYIYDSYNSMPIDSATISIGSLNAMTDSSGYFLIENVPEGSNQLRIDHIYYYIIDTLISVYGNLIINKELLPYMNDYFPLNVGTRWTFDFKGYEDNGTGEVSDQATGTMTWMVEGFSNNQNTTTHNIRVEVNYRAMHWSYGTFTRDTTIDTVVTFNILEEDDVNNNKRIIITELHQTDHFFRELKVVFKVIAKVFNAYYDYGPVMRYYPRYYGDMIKIKWEDLIEVYIDLQKDIGLTYLREMEVDMGYSDFLTLTKVD